jgi:hypothetical protein
MGKGFGWLRRTLYFVSGALGIYWVYSLVTNWSIFVASMGLGVILQILGIIFVLNWLPVAFTGDGNKDLLWLIGLEK